MTDRNVADLRLRPLRRDDRDAVLTLAERLAVGGNPPWRDPAAMRAFHRRYAEATLAVGEAAEGQGVGRGLTAAAEDRARRQGYRLLALEVFAGNVHAREFYRRLGCQAETLKRVKQLAP